MNNMKEDEGFFGGLFDLNGDGKLDDSEKIMDFCGIHGNDASFLSPNRTHFIK